LDLQRSGNSPKSGFAFLELFVALYEGGEFSFGQDSVIAISGQVRDQLTLTFYTAFTIGNPIRRRAD
jgi:hypothetical protein